MEWITRQTASAKEALDDTRAVVGRSMKPAPVVVSGRLGALARSNTFLWMETNLRALEHYSRAVPVGRRVTRAWILLTLAADLISGYALLEQCGRLSKSLSGPEDWIWQHQRGALHFRDTAAELGGTLIKAGQFASTRPDILPVEYVRTLASLQDHVPAQPWPVMRRAIERELGRRPEEVFRWIDHRPLASASIAQVHRAILPAGRQVAVKIQYPGIKEVIASDLTILQTIVSGVRQIAHGVQLQPILDHLAETLPLELDFNREAEAMACLRAALEHRDDVIIPKVVWELSTPRLLTMDYTPGIKITDLPALEAAGLSPHDVAILLNDVYGEQMLRLGRLHADPHPGNLLVRRGPAGTPQLVLLDHGLTVELSPALMAALQEMVRALSAGDLGRLAEALRKAGMPLDADVDIASLLQIVGVLLNQPHEQGKDSVLEVGQRFGQGIGHIPVDLILVGRALGLLDGVTRQLDPDLQALAVICGYATPDKALEDHRGRTAGN